MRQVQQQKWQLPGNPGRRTSMLTLAPITSLSQLQFRPWAFTTHQLATPWLILDLGSLICISTGKARETNYLFQKISVFGAAL